MKNEAINNLYDAGNTIREKIGEKAIKVQVWELSNSVKSNDMNQFMNKAMTLHARYGLSMPPELLKAKENTDLAQAFVMGMLGEKRN